jgi:2-C-methyl-D-erythritol 4-phosphate cytidylyltransferase
VVEGEARNIKITTPEDVAVARAIMGFKEAEGRAVHKRF